MFLCSQPRPIPQGEAPASRTSAPADPTMWGPEAQEVPLLLGKRNFSTRP